MSNQEAIEDIRNNIKPIVGGKSLDMAIEALEERKRGHWIEVNDSYNRISGRCSVCGWESHMYEDDVVGMDYCPNCGAFMDGKDGNDGTSRTL